MKTPPSSSPLSASSAPYVVANGARPGWGHEDDSYGSESGSTAGRGLMLELCFPTFSRLPETTTQLSPPQGSSSPLSPPARSVTIPDQLLNTCRLQPIIFKGSDSRFMLIADASSQPSPVKNKQSRLTHSSLRFVLEQAQSVRAGEQVMFAVNIQQMAPVSTPLPEGSEVSHQLGGLSQTLWPDSSHDTHSSLCIVCKGSTSNVCQTAIHSLLLAIIR